MLKVATVFSGIGAFEQALEKKKINHEIIFACDTGERYLNIDSKEIDNLIYGLSEIEKIKFINDLYAKTGKENFVKNSYFKNYKIEIDRWYDDIRYLDGKKYKNKIDIFVGGSPCQSFSIIGKKAGLDDSRGTLFFDFARLINEISPKVFIYENVTGLLSHDKGRTWRIIKEVFESLDYNIEYKVLNSVDFGIPQNRKRIFVIGFNKKLNLKKKFLFPEEIKLKVEAKDYLEDNNNISHLHYLGKKGFEFVTNPKYKNRARVDKKIIQTQKANQQYNWNGDFVFVKYDEIKKNKEIMNRAFVGYLNGKKGVIRQMTNRECLRLMGFKDDFKIVVPRVQAYRQAGNSIVVNIMEHLLESIVEVVDFNE